MRPSYRALLAASIALNVALLLSIAAPFNSAGAQSQLLYFPETGHTIRGVFLTYWTDHGGLAQQGYPLTEEFQETNALDGKVYTVQYFERAVFEKHPENPPPYDVLLSQLGRAALDARYPNRSNPAEARVTAPPAPPTRTATPTPTKTLTPTPSFTPLPSPTAQAPILSVPYCQSAPDVINVDEFVCWSSEQGDYIGQGQNKIWTPYNSTIGLALVRNGPGRQLLGVEVNDGNAEWGMDFVPPDNKPLFPGRYLGVQRYPFHDKAVGGFNADGDHRGCNMLTADFEILDIAVDPATGEVQRFAANFKQSCENNMPPLRGEVRYHSSVKP